MNKKPVICWYCRYVNKCIPKERPKDKCKSFVPYKELRKIKIKIHGTKHYVDADRVTLRQIAEWLSIPLYTVKSRTKNGKHRTEKLKELCEFCAQCGHPIRYTSGKQTKFFVISSDTSEN